MSHKVLKVVLFALLTGYFLPEVKSESLDTVSMKMRRYAIGATASITSDVDGFTWFATQFGILRFDGEQFINLQELAPQLSLPRDQAYVHIHADNNNQLWLLSWTDMFKIDLNTYKLQIFSKFPSIGEVALSYKILERNDGSILFPHHNQVIQYEPIGDSLIYHKLNFEEPNVHLRQIVEIENDLIYISSMEQSFYWNMRTNVIEKVMNQDLFSDYRNVVVYDGAGHLWINSWYNKNAGLVKYNIVKNEIVEIYNSQPAAEKFLGNTDFWGMELIDDELFIAANNGFWKINTNTNESSYIIIDEALSSKNRVNQLRCLHVDNNGNIWLGSNVNTYHSIKNEKRFEILRTEGSNIGLTTSPTTTIANISSTKIAVGTANGVSIYNTENQTYHNYQLPYYNGNSYNNYITAIEKNDDRSYWVGTWSGLYLMNSNNHNTLKYYITFPNAGTDHPDHVKYLNVGAVDDLCIDGNGNLWMVNNGGKICRLIESTEKDHFKFIDNTHIKNEIFSQLLYTTQYGLIASGSHGLWQYEDEKNTFRKIKTNNIKLDEESVKGMLNMYGGRILAITSTDIYSVHHVNGKDTIELIASLSQYDRLSNPIIGLDQNLWLPTKDGILKYDLATKEDYFFESDLYLEGIGFDVSSGFEISTMAESGNIYFASVDGVVEMDPENMHFDKNPPKLIITSIESNGKPISQLPFHKLTDIVLKPNNDNLLLKITAINDQLPQKTNYKYKLNSNPWIDLGTENSIALSGLAPGYYTINLTAISSDGIESREPLIINFRLKPPFYKTIWAYGLYLCLFFGITYWIYKARLNQKLKREKLRTNISRNLHDEVGGILAGIAMKSDLALQPYSNHKEEITQIASLSRKALNKMRDVLWSIDARRDNKPDLIDKMKDHVAELCGIAGIEFGFVVEGIEEGKLNAENRQNIYLIFKEAVNNVLKHAEATQLNISIHNYDKFRMKIQDNGIGNSNGHSRKGQGLENMHMRAQELKGEIKIDFNGGGSVELICPKI